MIRHVGHLTLIKRLKETPFLLHRRIRSSDCLTRTANASRLNPLKPHYSFKSVRDKCVRYKNSSATISRRIRNCRKGRGEEEDTEGAASESYQGGDWTNDTVSKFPRSVERRKRASPSKSVRQLILQGRKRKQKVNSPARIPGPSSRRWVLYLR